jgi:hypothetical protein
MTMDVDGQETERQLLVSSLTGKVRTKFYFTG